MTDAAVIWHDLECGSYVADLPLWRELAADRNGKAILDVGAGTGRVTLDLARHGHDLLALERDRVLASELSARAAALRSAGAGGSIEVICADACDFTLPQPVGLCIVPMQTVQLLEDRAGFLRCAAAALVAGGLLAVAVLGEGLMPFSTELDPDTVVRAGVTYASTPTALHQNGRAIVLERRRAATWGAQQEVSIDVIELAALDPAALIAEAESAGFASRGVRSLAPTVEHVGTEVVLLEAVAP
jgi:SAM-dependent methyltransferase